jgi:hypothetical protein
MTEYFSEEKFLKTDLFDMTPLDYAAKFCRDRNCLELIFIKVKKFDINQTLFNRLNIIANVSGNSSFRNILNNKINNNKKRVMLFEDKSSSIKSPRLNTCYNSQNMKFDINK